MSVRNLTRIFLAVLLVAWADISFAWDTSASVSVSETYTDNRCLSSSDKDGAWITSVTPEVGLSGESSRVSLSLQGSVDVSSQVAGRDDCPSSSFGNRGNRDRVNPELSADGNLELIRQTLFVDASARIRQNAVDSFSSFDDSNLNARGNRNTTYSYSVSPYFTSRIGDVASVYLRASYSDQTNSAREVDDSASESVSLSIQSIGNAALSWGLNGSYTREDYDESQLEPGEENELASASATLGYQLSRKWQINATAGEDFNEFSTVSEDTEGKYWDAGIRWTPSSRTNVEMGYGDRFYGDSHRFSLTHKHRSRQLNVSYDKSVTSTRELREQDVFIPLLDEEGNQFTIGDIPLFFPSTQTTLTRSPIIEERIQASYRQQGRMMTVGLKVSISDQLRLEDELSSTFTRYDISADRKVGSNVNLNAQITYEDRQADTGSILGRDSDTWRYRLGLTKGLGINTKLSLNLTHTDRNSEADRDEYRENRITATLTMDLK